MRMINNKKIKILTISILCILTITIGLSYGYYLLNKVQENNNIAGSKCFNLEFTNEKNAISLDNTYPISDEEGRKLTPYSFTITNTCDMLAGYTVNMEMLEGTTLNSKYLDVMVNNEQIKLLTNYESTNTVITGSTESRILAKGTLAYNDSVDYTVRFWMDKDVEDTESMNKLFKSKIVISATPSSWNPKDAGYDTLHDAILANEYQSTPEDALKRIEAKGTPDLSKSAPIIQWSEKIGDSTEITIIKPTDKVLENEEVASNLPKDSSLLKLYTSKNFNNDTANYGLGNEQNVDPTTIDYSDDLKYFYSKDEVYYDSKKNKLSTAISNGGIVIYQVLSAVKSNTKTIWGDIEYDTITYKLKVKELTSVKLETDKSDKGIYKDYDDYGTTYYYRGDTTNNNVAFGGYYWKIVRINGDDSIRIMYNGKSSEATGLNQSINEKAYQFNNLYDNPAYVGYMYGNSNATTFEEVHANINSSSVKTSIDNWYKTNFMSNGYDDYISKNTGFCGDRNLYEGNGIDSEQITKFKSIFRLKNNNPIFKCENTADDLYTTKESKNGNKALIYPIALISYDELHFSGLDNSHINDLNWAYSSNDYWTMTPFGFSNNGCYNWRFHNDGKLASWWYIIDYLSVRPVINLKSDVKITGGIGTSNDPFVIDTSK